MMDARSYFSEILERYVAASHTHLAQRVEAALTVHADHLAAVTLEEHLSDLTRVVRCSACQTVDEIAFMER